MSTKEFACGLRHLRKDTALTAVIARHPKPDIGKNDDPYEALCRSIIYQQLSGKAAGTIHGRFVALFPNQKPVPQALLKKRRETLRKCGLSNQKTDYLYDLSRKFKEGFITPEKFPQMTDEEIREHLVAVKGIGVWTADMFLMFTLGRLDVLPTGDLGIKKGFQKLFKLKKLPTEERMLQLARPWRPYATLASCYLWRLADEGNKMR